MTVSDRFWCKVERRDPDACWPWTASVQRGGYGQFGVQGTMRAAHRVAYELTHGVALAQAQHVCHRCDNPRCCNPGHLFLGTQADNLADMRAKGRARGGSMPGTSNPASRLTESMVAEIRRRLAAGERQVDIAAAVGISRAAVSKIRTGRTWPLSVRGFAR